MGKKLTAKQQVVVRRVANKLRASDQLVQTIVSEFLAEQSARPVPRRSGKTKGAK